MLQICEFDEKRDIARVVEGLDIDLEMAIETGTVLDTGVAVDYNGIESASRVGVRVGDVFQAIDYQKYLNSKFSKPIVDKVPTGSSAVKSAEQTISE